MKVTAVFAADAVARLSGVIGVAAVTAGPGLTNTVTAVKNAQMAESPFLLLGGAAATLLKVCFKYTGTTIHDQQFSVPGGSQLGKCDCTNGTDRNHRRSICFAIDNSTCNSCSAIFNMQFSISSFQYTILNQQLSIYNSQFQQFSICNSQSAIFNVQFLISNF